MRQIQDNRKKRPKKKKHPVLSKGTSLEFDHFWAVDKLISSSNECPKGMLYIP
ncbi:MAG: hypothetical protein Q8867_09285 [Bacteroidota bacterium]|nr:hypothetical protein [Bacteroidota bacterium]